MDRNQEGLMEDMTRFDPLASVKKVPGGSEPGLSPLIVVLAAELDYANQEKIDILESITDCYYELDRDLRFVYVNRAAEELWGSSREWLIGLRIEEAFPDLIDIPPEQIHQVLEKQAPQTCEVFLPVVQRWGELRILPIRTGMSVYFRDTTEQKLAGDELRKMRNELARKAQRLDEEIERRRKYALELQSAQQAADSILESISDAFYALDKDCRFTYLNSEAVRMFGIQDAADWLGKVLWEAIPNHTKMTYEMIHKTLYERIPHQYEIYSQDIGCWLDVHTYPAPSGISVYFLDITRRKQAEDALRQSEERFAKIFHNSPNIMVINRMKDGRYVDINCKYTEVLGYTRDDVIGHTPWELNIFTDSRHDVSAFTHTANGQHIAKDYELAFRSKSGQIIHTMCSSEIIHIQGGDYVLTVMRDVTDQKNLESDIARLDRLHLIGKMAASIGHEIRNPMTAVRGFLQMLREKNDYQEDRGYFDLMIEELDRANTIITEYLGLAKDKRNDLQPRQMDDIILSLPHYSFRRPAKGHEPETRIKRPPSG